MKVTQVTLGKHYKCGLPNFSNITTSISMTWDVADGEEFDFVKGWDVINQQLGIQGNDMDQNWMKTTELKDSYKTVIKTPKEAYVK